MNINSVGLGYTNNNLYKNNYSNYMSQPTFKGSQSDGATKTKHKSKVLPRAAALGTAALLTTSLTSCTPTAPVKAINNATTTTPSAIVQQKEADSFDITPVEIDSSAFNIGSTLFVENGGFETIEITSNYPEDMSNLVSPNDCSCVCLSEAKTLGEIVDQGYNYIQHAANMPEAQSLRNKCIAEIIDANPQLKDFFGEDYDFQYAANYDLSRSFEYDEKIVVPRTLYIQQATSDGNEEFNSVVNVYAPVVKQASVDSTAKEETDTTFKTLDSLIRGVYPNGAELTDAEVNFIAGQIAQVNPEQFEIAENDITDINRIKKAPADLKDLTLPAVVISSSSDGEVGKIDSNSKNNPYNNGVTFQIYPVGYTGKQNSMEMEIKPTLLKDNYRYEDGDIIDLDSALQFYIDPLSGKQLVYRDCGSETSVLDKSIYNAEMLANEIKTQLVYSNLHIFAAEQEIDGKVYPYGAFDVNEGYDVTGKSIEDIIQNSTLNMDRANQIKFIDKETGELRLPEGTKFNLCEFDYCLADYTKAEKPIVVPPQDPTQDPTQEPTLEPTHDPTHEPTHDPTHEPTHDPTHEPTHEPTHDPTHEPTHDPTHEPTCETEEPDVPTEEPIPTLEPTHEPTHIPTYEPTHEPTHIPTHEPTGLPTIDPGREVDPVPMPTTPTACDPEDLDTPIEEPMPAFGTEAAPVTTTYTPTEAPAKQPETSYNDGIPTPNVAEEVVESSPVSVQDSTPTGQQEISVVTEPVVETPQQFDVPSSDTGCGEGDADTYIKEEMPGF